MATDPHQQYRKIQAQTASPGQLVLMLYEGALRFLRTAEQGLVDGDVERAHHGMTRAQDIICELMSSLDSSAGELAENLLALYVYLYRRLAESNVRKDVGPVREALEILAQLQGAWRQALTGTGPGHHRVHAAERPAMGALNA